MASGEREFMNPHYDILAAVKTALQAAPAISGLPTPQVRELPYELGSDSLPLCLVCPGRTGKRIAKKSFARKRFVVYPVVVLLVHASNMAVASGLESRLQLEHDVFHRLDVATISGAGDVMDVDPDPRAAADVQAALGTNRIVSGVELQVKNVEDRSS